MTAPSAGAVGDEEHLVADRLDHPATAGGDDVRGQALEPLHEDAELVLLEPLGQACVRDEVGEADRERRGGRDVARLGRAREPAGRRGEMAAPDVHEQHLEVVRQRTEPVERLLGPRAAGGREVLDQGLGLPADQPVRALAHRPGERDRGGLVEQSGPHQPGDPGEGVDVGVREGHVAVRDVREPQRTPQLAGGHLRDAGLSRDLAAAPAARSPEQPPLQRRPASTGPTSSPPGPGSVTGAAGKGRMRAPSGGSSRAVLSGRFPSGRT